MKLKVYKSDGSLGQEAEFDKIPSLEGEKGVQALKEVIVAQAANARQGTASTKTRGEVSGGGRKPWRQKGTGRARAGSNRSPLWSGGGVVFGPKPRDYSKKINKKVKDLAFRRAFFDRAVSGEILVLEALESQGKTKQISGLLDKVAPEGTVLLVEKRFSDEAIRAARNLPHVVLREADHVSSTDLCLCDRVVVTSQALDALIERLN
jgi:large subunit ribosomal protein L4